MRKLVILAALTAACSDAGPSGPGEPQSLSIIAGDHQTGVVGAALGAPIVVRAFDGTNRAVPHASVVVEISSGHGHVTNATAVANDSGDVSIAWTLGTSTTDEQALTVRLSARPQSAVIAHATASPEAASGLAVVVAPGATLRIGKAVSASVAVADKYGNIVANSGVAVSASAFASSGQHGLAGETSALTDATGTANFAQLTALGDTGTFSLRFAAPSLTPADLIVRAVPGAPNGLQAVDGLTLSGTIADAGPPIRVRVVDTSGNAVAGEPVTFTFPAGVGGQSVTSDAAGVATSNGWTLPASVGTYRVTATSGALPPLTFSVTVRAGKPVTMRGVAEIAISGPATSLAPALRVIVLDVAGNPIAGETVTFSSSDGSPDAIATTDASGTASYSASHFPEKASTVSTVTARLGSLTPVVFHLTASVGPAARVTLLTVPSVMKVLDTAAVRVQVTDAGGNPILPAVPRWSAPGGNATILSSQASTGIDGSASVNVVFGTKAAPTTLRVTIDGWSGDVTVVPSAGRPVTVRFLEGDTVSAVNAVARLVFRLTDSWGNVVTTGGNPVHRMDQTPALTPIFVTTDANGKATFGLQLGARAGVYTAGVEIPGLDFSFSLIDVRAAGSQASLAPVGPVQFSSGVGSEFLPTIALNEADGRPAVSSAVTFTVDPNNGYIRYYQGAPSAGVTVSTVTLRPDRQDGSAWVIWVTPRIPGTYQMRAVAPAPYANNVVVFTATIH